MPTSQTNIQNKTLRTAIIGYGLAGSAFHAPVIAATSGMHVSAVVTSNVERQQKARQRYPDITLYTHTDELWRDASQYDVVVVATPNRAHVPLGIAAMEAGLATIIDKPLAATATDAEKLIEVSKRTGKLLTVFQNRRWDGDFLTVRKILDAELLGPITRFESRIERYRAEPKLNSARESPDPADAGGQLYDLGSHIIDQALYLFGKPVSVYAEMVKRRPNVQVDDDSFVALQFANGVNAHLWMSQVARIAGPRFLLRGLHGTYEKWGADPQEDALREGKTPTDTNWGTEPKELWGHISIDIDSIHIDGQVETLPGAYQQYYALLRDALTVGSAPPVDLAGVVLALRIIEAAQQSASEGRVIHL